ncbi:MAG: sensor histidine kinase [Thermoactinospora sp.]|nr:sensor histidine kinase [Thermoactinospora sp.]
MNRVDVMVAPVVGALMVGTAALNGVAGPAGYGLLVLSAAALAAHRRHPLPVLAVTSVLAACYVLAVEPEMAATIPALITLASVVRHGHRRASQVAALGLVAAMTGGYLLSDQPVLAAVKGGFLVMGWFVAAVAMGIALQQADRRALDAEHSREEAALRRAGEERLRIARELHDSLTHTISVIKVQAGVAVHLTSKRGEQASPALLAIQEASGEAMRELRETLEVLRDDTVALARLPELISRMRAMGQEVALTVEGNTRALPASVDQAAFRIVQEALTNCVRHAPGAQASVLVEYGKEEVVVEVSDTGGAAAPDEGLPGGGKGLTGMRERVDALGGRLEAGPAGRGFTVKAWLPVEVTVGLTGKALPA